MTTLSGWLLAFPFIVLWARARHRLSLAADAEHELRSPLAALVLGVETLARTAQRAHGLDLEIVRVRLGLADLAAARSGRRAAAAERERLAQAVGNLVANAEEHGGGVVALRSRRTPQGVRVEVLDRAPTRPKAKRPRPGAARGRGLRIAARAAEDAGGELVVIEGGVGVELPAEPEPAA